MRKFSSTFFTIAISVSLGVFAVNGAIASPSGSQKPQHSEHSKKSEHADSKSDQKENAEKPSKEPKENPAATIPDAASKPVFTEHTTSIHGKPFSYRAETGMLPLLSPDGKTRASVFFVAYTKKGEKDTAKRPITFCFNGGPGAASVWLHLGGLGPYRAKMNPDGSLPAPPFQVVNNEFSILDTTDLVFIDPVATGYSRPSKGEKTDQFFGAKKDIQAMAEFIRLYTTRHERWLSPKYLCGESYGVFRAAGLSDYLQQHDGMYLNGLILMSGLVDYSTLMPSSGNDLPYIVFLPSYATTAHYFKKLPADLQKQSAETVLAEAQKFANGEYATALLKGNSLTAKERHHVAEQLSRFTSLPVSLIENSNLRISPSFFRKELLHDQGLIIGRYDARITGRDGDPASQYPGFDPSFAAALGPLSAAANSYFRTNLKYKDDLPYRVLTSVQPWEFPDNRYASVSDQLADAVSENPHLRVIVLQGLRDLACPIGCMKYSIDHLQIAPQLLSNFQFEHYLDGHMIYLNQPSLKKLQGDLEKFIH